jgi:hypothetical protein
VNQAGDGWRWPFPGFAELAKNASVAGLGESERALIGAKAVAQPWATYTQQLRLQHADAGDAVPYRRVAIACDDIRRLVAAGVPQIVTLTAPPWHYLELETGHWPMFSAPAALAEMLDGLVVGQ